MSELQGGQKVRVLLAQALFGNPEALLLDEPTNYLDLDSIHWLEDFLNRYNGTVITISHDRHFLNSVCTHIADIDYETIITYTGGYDDMVLQKTQHPHPHREPERAAREEDRAAERLHRPLLRRYAQLAGELAQEGSRAPRNHASSRAPTFRARTSASRCCVPRASTCSSSRASTRPTRSPTARPSTSSTTSPPPFMRGDKVVLIGRNGQGKTTMLKALLANAGLDEAEGRLPSTPAPSSGDTRRRSATSRRTTRAPSNSA